MQEDAAKDSLEIMEVGEKEADKTVCLQSSAAVETTLLKASETEQGAEDELMEGGQSPVLLPSQDTDDRPDVHVVLSCTVSPAPSTSSSSQVCSSFVLHLSPSQPTQHGTDMMEIETAKQPTLQSGSEVENVSPLSLLHAKPLSDNAVVQDKDATLIQAHSSSHQLSNYDPSQLSGKNCSRC